MNAMGWQAKRRCATSLLLLAALALIAWPFSYWRTAGVECCVGFGISHGSLAMIIRDEKYYHRYFYFDQPRPIADIPRIHTLLNFVYLKTAHSMAIGIPLWLCSIALGYFGLKFLKSARAVESSLCRVCGYDLRATPDRCPECGTIPTSSK
jgi:hypothetical protein